MPYVTIERGGPVAILRYDRGEKLNAMNDSAIAELTEAARSFHEDFDTRAVVLTGTARCFSAGADIDTMSERIEGEEPMSDALRRHRFGAGGRLCDAWEAMPQVTIAAIEGPAVGAGVALALALDWRVMGEGAYLYVPELKIGLNLQWGALPRLVSLVGPARAKRICILCERMGADRALDWGLVDDIADDGAALDSAIAMAEAAAAMPQVATQMIKQAVNATAGALHRAVSFADADQCQLAMGLEDARAARQAFRQRGG